MATLNMQEEKEKNIVIIILESSVILEFDMHLVIIIDQKIMYSYASKILVSRG